ncbi:12661_t:CDS:1 [Funneliformis geosporum]|uniref:5562_t:CDS:1 n=1 Tax=Funneliformis geosporum TaxID=1117311 RepID=A0A9W4SRB0_9GLOM|nr:12661_t:CDS:1 [Funneliformis geosporum]CAI2178753.1 5562_t:CDS:1 [Funneliformis geosporum]
MAMDCLGEIFKCFPGDNNTLFQCMLVNKMWCASAVATLWRDPFAMLIAKTESSSLYNDNALTDQETRAQASRFLTVFLEKLSEESRSLLIRNGIKLPKISTKKPMFEYLEFISTFDIVRFSLTVSYWIFCGGKRGRKTRFQCFLVEQEIYKVVVNRCPHIIKFRCVEDFFECDSDLLPVFNFTYLLSSSNQMFSNIREFECSAGFTTDQIYFVLSQLITKLDTLKISSAPDYFDDDFYGLTEFIKAQQSLRNIEFICHNKEFDDLQYRNKEIGKALEKQAKSLIRLRIHGYQGVPFETFCYFENLREMSLYFFDDMPQETEDKLVRMKFKKLHKFYVKAASLDFSKIAKFIRQNGKNLVDVKIEVDSSLDNEQSGLILDAVAYSCPNIITFHGTIDPINVESQLRFFCKQCRKLNNLGLNLVEDKFDACDIYDILNVLGECAPRSIFNFIFEGDWDYLKCTLEAFLKQRQSIAPFRVIYIGYIDIGGMRKSKGDIFESENYNSDYDDSDYSDSQFGSTTHFGDMDFINCGDSNGDSFDDDYDFGMNSLTKYFEEGILEIRSPIHGDFKF